MGVIWSNFELFGLVVIVSLFVFAITLIVADDVYTDGADEHYEHLGGSICEEEYGKMFDRYDTTTQILYCKDAIETYDGLKISLNGGTIK